MKNETIWIICLAIFAALALFQTVSVYGFTQLDHLMIIKKRYPRFVMVEAALVIVCLAVVFPIQAKLMFAPEFIISIPMPVSFALAVVLLNTIRVMECGRHWLIAFDLMYLSYSVNEQWKTVINAGHAANNWVVRSQHRFGTVRNVIKIMVAVLLFEVLFAIFFVVGFGVNPLHIIALYSVGYVVFIGAVFYKCRKHQDLDDAFLFFFELRATAIIWTLCFISHSVTTLTGTDIGFARLVMPVVVVLTPSILSTFVIPYKIRAQELWKNERVKHRTLQATKAEMALRDANFRELLKDADGVKFDLFMCGLHKEMSEELGYAWIEMIQFKQFILANELKKAGVCGSTTDQPRTDLELILEYGGINEEEEKKEDVETKVAEETVTIEMAVPNKNKRPRVDYAIDLCPVTAPRSTAVYHPRTGLSDDGIYRVIAQELWEKYIRVGSCLEINIDWEMRQFYADCASRNWDMPLIKLVTVFDKALREILILLARVFCRYTMRLDRIEKMMNN